MAQISRLYNTNSTLYRSWFAIFWKATNAYEEEPHLNPIRLAAVLGHGEVLKWILQWNQHYEMDETDETGQTALILASLYGHEMVVHILLEARADVNAKGGRYGNALQAASERGQEKVVQILLEAGANVNAQGGFYGHALQAASERGHEKVVQMLLDKGANISAEGDYGHTL